MGWEEGVGCVGGQWIGGTSVVVMLGGTVMEGNGGGWARGRTEVLVVLLVGLGGGWARHGPLSWCSHREFLPLIPM